MVGPGERELRKRKKRKEKKKKKIGGMIKDSIGTQYKLKLKPPINVWP